MTKPADPTLDMLLDLTDAMERALADLNGWERFAVAAKLVADELIQNGTAEQRAMLRDIIKGVQARYAAGEDV